MADRRHLLAFAGNTSTLTSSSSNAHGPQRPAGISSLVAALVASLAVAALNTVVNEVLRLSSADLCDHVFYPRLTRLRCRKTTSSAHESTAAEDEEARGAQLAGAESTTRAQGTSRSLVQQPTRWPLSWVPSTMLYSFSDNALIDEVGLDAWLSVAVLRLAIKVRACCPRHQYSCRIRLEAE